MTLKEGTMDQRHGDEEEGHGCCGGGCRREGRGGGHEGDTAQMWQQAFHEALREVHREALKEKIRKSWGKNIDAVAEEVVKAMAEEWASFMLREAAGAKLRDIVRKGFEKGPQ